MSNALGIKSGTKNIQVAQIGNKSIPMSLEKLIDSKLLITASSGGGKSYALRKILEQTARLVQQFVFDTEGEFENLLENYGYLIINDRDSAIKIGGFDPFHLAQELLKRKSSAIFDISNLDPDSRGEFIKRFVEGMMAIDSEFWTHVIVAIDEAHLFAPQQDKSPAKKVLIDLACRGRKRGYCPIFATQRLVRLNKSVVSELQTRFIGQMTLDIDIKRAAEELGMSTGAAIEALSDLDVGEFLAYGPAISRSIQKIKIREPKTSHGSLPAEISPPAPLTKKSTGELLVALIKAGNDAPPSTEEDRNFNDEEQHEDEV